MTTTPAPGPNPTQREGMGIDPELNEDTTIAPAATKEDSGPQSIRKVHRPM